MTETTEKFAPMTGRQRPILFEDLNRRYEKEENDFEGIEEFLDGQKNTYDFGMVKLERVSDALILGETNFGSQNGPTNINVKEGKFEIDISEK